MSFRPLSSPFSSAALVLVLGALGCSDSGGSTGGNGGSTAQGGSGTSGGKTGAGGSTNPGNGGSTSGGSANGGASNGGSEAKGGNSSGGSSAGGATGAGGSTAGATSSGGKAASGGSSAGGSSPTGGSSSGGRPATGGGPAGGASAGGPAGGTGSGGGGSVKVCDTASTLKAAAACNNKLIGAAISHNGWSNQQYANAANEFNYVTPENGMKWEVIEKSQNSFDFSQGDALVSWAGSSKKIKGHTLVWHSQLASWVNSLSGTQVKEAMLNHIDKVMTHYKGKLHAWDVVNEAWVTTSGGGENKQGVGTASLRDSPFKKIGDNFIDLAFSKAREIDPNALLFYNDYSAERMNDKSNAIYNMVKSMKERNIPIDGVGMQMHIGAPNDIPTAASIKENIDRITALGLQVQISEMDTNTCDSKVPVSDVAKYYHDIVAVCVANPLCTAITVWGISDAGTWLKDFSESPCGGRTPDALLFDTAYKPKPSYDATIQALIGK